MKYKIAGRMISSTKIAGSELRARRRAFVHSYRKRKSLVWPGLDGRIPFMIQSAGRCE
jgi:hypothetical protein